MDSNSICTRKNAFIASIITTVILAELNVHVLLPFYGMLLPGLPNMSCGPTSAYTEYNIFYLYKWSYIQVCKR